MFPRVLIPVALLLALGGCAFNNSKNTPLLAALDEAVQPETPAAKVAWGVVFVPVGVVAGALDVLIIHPARSVVPAAQDTWRTVWADPPDTATPARQAAFFLPKLALTPLVFSFSWLGNSLLDLPRAQPPQTETEQ